MDEFANAYLRCDAEMTLVPGRLSPPESPGGSAPDSTPVYPANEVAAALSRLRGVRGPTRRSPRMQRDIHSPHRAQTPWSELQWRWHEADRDILIGLTTCPDDTTEGADALWAGSPLTAHCLYEDVGRLALAFTRRFPSARLRLDDGQAHTVAAFIEQVALARLTPALASDDSAIRAQALASQAAYAELLASAPKPLTLAEALAAAPFTTLYEDSQLLAVNKPAGVVTHPTYKHPDGTLTDAVFAQEEARGKSRPWLLHRLDKQTSGIVLFARTELARRSLSSQFAQHTARKRYLALAVWPPTTAPDLPEGEVDAPLARDPLDRRRVIVAPDGQPSRTRYRRLAVAPGYALIQAEPVTGRTHQIRAHLAAIGAPLVGDATYLPDDALARDLAPRVMLHAWRLDLRSPGRDTPWSVTAPVPDDFLAAADALGLGDAVRATLAQSHE